MSDDALIRLENLRSLKLSAPELSLRVGGAKSYWHGMLAGTRPFGEKIARKIEDKIGLARGWLDESQTRTPRKESDHTQEKPATLLSGELQLMVNDYLSLPDSVRVDAFVEIAGVIAKNRQRARRMRDKAPSLIQERQTGKVR